MDLTFYILWAFILALITGWNKKIWNPICLWESLLDFTKILASIGHSVGCE